MPFAHINGTTLNYQVKGEGIPILFIHPPLLTKANFIYQASQLSDMYKVITFDIRGHGHSPATFEQVLTYSLIAEDMIKLLDHLNIKKAYLCGYSTGGAVALEAILEYPDRFYGGILVSAMSEVSDWYLKARLAAAVSLCQAKAKKMLMYAICRGNADCRATYYQLSKDAEPGSLNTWQQYYEYSIRYRCTDRLREIQSPMLLVYGRKNYSFYRYADLLEQHLPNNKLVLIRGVSHQIPTRAALSLNEIIRRWVTDVHKETQTPDYKEEAESPHLEFPINGTPDLQEHDEQSHQI